MANSVVCLFTYEVVLGSLSGTSESLRTVEIEATTSQFLPGGDQAWEPGERMLWGELLPGRGLRDLPDQREDGNLSIHVSESHVSFMMDVQWSEGMFQTKRSDLPTQLKFIHKN